MLRDVGVVQRRRATWLRARSARARSASCANASGRTLIATSRLKLRVARAIDLAHAAHADLGGDFIGAEPGARGKCHYAPRAFYAITPE